METQMVVTACLRTFFLFFAGFIPLGLTGCLEPKDQLPIATQSGYVKVAEGHLFFQKFGSGSPIVVLHGGPGLDQSYLLPQILELAKDHEVILYDQRGSGHSLLTKTDPQSLNLERFTEDLETLRQTLGLKRMILIGHSWGGLLAMNYATKHPKRLSHLILMCSSPANYTGHQAFMAEFTKRSKPIQGTVQTLFNPEALKKLTRSEIQTLYNTLFSVYFYAPKQSEHLNFTLTKKSALAGLKVLELMSTPPWFTPNGTILPALKRLQVPTLILHGNQDIIPRHTSEEIHKAIQNSRLVSIDQCGHFPYIEKSAELFSAIRMFLRTQPKP